MLSRRHLLLSLPLPGAARAEPGPAAPLRVVSGDLPPFAIEGQPQRPGVLAELVEELMRRCGQALQVEFYPWARAVQMAAQQPRVAILPLTRTPEREGAYQWLLKLYVQRFVFINLAGRAPIQRAEQARQQRIAVLRASANLALLQRHRFSDTQVVQASSVGDMLRLLERGHVDAVYGSELIILDKIRSSGRDPARFQVGLELEAGEVWLAAGSGVEAAERARMLEVQQAMLRDGSIERLFRAYGIRPREQDLH